MLPLCVTFVTVFRVSSAYNVCINAPAMWLHVCLCCGGMLSMPLRSYVLGCLERGPPLHCLFLCPSSYHVFMCTHPPPNPLRDVLGCLERDPLYAKGGLLYRLYNTPRASAAQG